MTEHGSNPRRRASRLLRNPLAVISAALASFLVVMVLLTSRVVMGSDPALHASGPAAIVVSHGRRTVLGTSASGRVSAVNSAQPGEEVGGRSANLGVVTRSSGGYAQGGESDG